MSELDWMEGYGVCHNTLAAHWSFQRQEDLRVSRQRKPNSRTRIKVKRKASRRKGR